MSSNSGRRHSHRSRRRVLRRLKLALLYLACMAATAISLFFLLKMFRV